MIKEFRLKLARKKQVTTMNCNISTVMYWEGRPLTSRPHLCKVSIIFYIYFQWTEDWQGFRIQYLTPDT